MNLGRYRLVAELARGGMGIVHLAEARGPGGFEKLVVIKELKSELACDPVYRDMFLDEARLAARLSHRHIVQTNEVACCEGRYFMALELLEGGSLHQVHTKLGGPAAVPVVLGLRILVAILDALHYAHELTDADGRSLGVVHRDLSPQNVFLTFDGDVKLIDFGVAKSKDRRRQTQVGVVKGSVPYMSPDHVDARPIDRRADIFSVGVLLRELVTGERLWEGVDDLTILRRLILRALPPFPKRAAVPPRLREIAERAMAPERSDRFSTARAMREAIASYLAEVDPRGSLADLGAWLSPKLVAERAAFRALVRESRHLRVDTAPPPLPSSRADIAHVWMPSSELHTRFSAPPELAVTSPERRPANAEAPNGLRSRALAAAAMCLTAIALVVGGLSGASSNEHDAARTDTSPNAEARPGRLERALLENGLPPNPYGDGDDDDAERARQLQPQVPR